MPAGYNVIGDPRPVVTAYITNHKINEGTYPSLAVLIENISDQVTTYGSIAKVPAETVANTRNDMYLASEALRFLAKDKENDLSKDDVAALSTYNKTLDDFPWWVKASVAIALGLGTMIGWRRIVVT